MGGAEADACLQNMNIRCKRLIYEQMLLQWQQDLYVLKARQPNEPWGQPKIKKLFS